MLENFSRKQVFLTHLGISSVIFAVMAVLMVTDWFPGPFFMSDGGWQGMRIIAAVDLVLGPALTLIFFNPRKKKHPALLFDLTAIGLVQLLALIWGTWTVHNERTVAISFSLSQFYSISHGALKEADAIMQAAGRETRDIEQLSETHPRQIYVRKLDQESFSTYLKDVLNGMPEIQLRSDHYEPLHEHWDEVTAKALDIEKFAARSPKLAAAIAELGSRAEELEFYRLKLRYGHAVVAFHRERRTLEHLFSY